MWDSRFTAWPQFTIHDLAPIHDSRPGPKSLGRIAVTRGVSKPEDTKFRKFIAASDRSQLRGKRLDVGDRLAARERAADVGGGARFEHPHRADKRHHARECVLR